MDNIINKINSLFLRKYKNENINRFEHILASGNLQSLKYYTKGGALLLIYIMIAKSMLLNYTLINIIPFLIGICILLTVDFCTKRALRNGKRLLFYSKILTTTFSVTFVGLAIFYDTIVQRNDISVLLCAALLITGAIFDSYPTDTLLFLISTFTVALVGEAFLAPDIIFWHDLFNCSIMFLTSFYISVTKLNKKIYILIKEEKEQEKMMKEAKTQVILNQLKPHFLYNTLSTIRILYRKEPEKADQAMDNFSNYLRSNIDTGLSKNYIIFFEEIKNVKYYLDLEKLRFGKKLNIEYDIEEMNFYLPVLTLQPIVENAVKHGVGNKKGGGTIKISTYSDGDNIVLVVKDDGIGFEYNKSELENDDKKSHIGISSVTERIKMMVGGTVNIKSEANVGTTVTITIPKKIDEAKIDEYIGIRWWGINAMGINR